MQTQEEFNKFALNHIELYLLKSMQSFLFKNSISCFNALDYNIINLNGTGFIHLDETDRELFLTIKTRLDIVKKCKSEKTFPTVEHRKWVKEILDSENCFGY